MYNPVIDTERILHSLVAEQQKLLPRLHAQYHVQSLAVFGSYARRDENIGSDLDLLITFSQTPSLFEFVAWEGCLSDVLGIKADLVMKDSLKPAIGQVILAETEAV